MNNNLSVLLKALSLLALLIANASSVIKAEENKTNAITREDIARAEEIIGLKFEDKKRDQMAPSLEQHLRDFKAIRNLTISNSVPPALLFNPIPLGMQISSGPSRFEWSVPEGVKAPEKREELAWYSVAQIAALVKSKHVTSVELTKLALERLKKYSPQLECVISLTEDLALQEARRADEEIAAGKYRGPLHGIPYAAKDLLATKGVKTTWGSVPYKEQVIEQDATVIEKLREAGAVLVAKTTLGELAMGDVWYGGTTKNPWNTKQGSSGSSAGSAAATSAGLVPFAIGSETWGSIVSPATRCGVTGLRPSYGRVSRAGAMALSWSMDKLGPLARTVEDCALVFNAIRGPDLKDQTLIDAPFNYSAKVNWSALKIGYVEEDFAKERSGLAEDKALLEKVKSLGAKIVPIKLPDLPVEHISFLLSVEAAAAFDELTRSGRDDLMVRQTGGSWPNIFRSARFVPAVEYIQANRVRYLAIQKMAEVMKEVNLYIAPSSARNSGLLSNLTGHPCVVIPNGFNKDGEPMSITFIGRLFDEGTLLAVAQALQQSGDYHKKHPVGFD